MRALIVGCGYVGSAVAERLAADGHEVFGLRRNVAGDAADSRPRGWKPLVGDISRTAGLDQLPRNWDWVVNCVSSSFGGPNEYRQTYWEGMRNLLRWLAPDPPRKFVYTSSTSVYGHSEGEDVDEASPTRPAAETGKILLETEEVLLSTCRTSHFPGIILRLAGIYGPGRGYWFKQFLTDQAVIEGDGGRILNMIHRDDVVGATMSALENGQPGEVYNVVDDEPVSQIDFFRWLAGTLRRDLPSSGGPGQAQNKRASSNKRVLNGKLHSLGFQLKYPTFREGYLAEINRLGLRTAG